MVLLADWIWDVRERETSRTLMCVRWVTGRRAWRCHLKRGSTLEGESLSGVERRTEFNWDTLCYYIYMASVD